MLVVIVPICLFYGEFYLFFHHKWAFCIFFDLDYLILFKLSLHHISHVFLQIILMSKQERLCTCRAKHSV